MQFMMMLASFHFNVDDCKHLATCFQQVRFRFIRRSANEVVHYLKKAAYSLRCPMEWYVNPPSCLSALILVESY